jgi:hypothetical protein
MFSGAGRITDLGVRRGTRAIAGANHVNNSRSLLEVIKLAGKSQAAIRTLKIAGGIGTIGTMGAVIAEIVMHQQVLKETNILKEKLDEQKSSNEKLAEELEKRRIIDTLTPDSKRNLGIDTPTMSGHLNNVQTDYIRNNGLIQINEDIAPNFKLYGERFKNFFFLCYVSDIEVLVNDPYRRMELLASSLTGDVLYLPESEQPIIELNTNSFRGTQDNIISSARGRAYFITNQAIFAEIKL